MLPSSPEQLSEQIKEAPEEPEIVQLVTEGPQEIRELIPLFIIPGLSTENEIEELARCLLLPTFCAVLPSTPMSLKELAENYAAKIRSIWPTGPFNIVGVSWGGVLATEIAKILNKKSKVYLYFIDGAPSTLQSAVHHLGENSEMEVNLLTRIFTNNDAQFLKKLQSAKDWDARVSCVLSTYQAEVEDKKALEMGLLLLRTRLQDVMLFHPDGDLISGTSHLIRPGDCSQYDNCDLTLYLKQIPLIRLVNGDHRTIIKNKDTAEYINETFQLI